MTGAGDVEHGASVLELADPLAEFLGSVPAGTPFRYEYGDAVKLCGHSCPMVASAWRMTERALALLYPGERPTRGGIGITVGGSADDGAAGPRSQVFGLVTGAASETGFRGLLGRWPRQGLLRFDRSLGQRVRFSRVDTGAAVEVWYEPLPGLDSTDLRPMLQAAVCTDRHFRETWRATVERILTARITDIVQARTVDSGPTPAVG